MSARGQPLVVRTVDYHTAGEPFRIIVEGSPPLLGETVLERRSWTAEHADEFRKLLVSEPRGHADMYGCHVTPPDDAGAAFGLVFFHKDGYSTACGHGTIAAATWAVDSGLVGAPEDGDESFPIDVPSGRVTARVRREDGRVVDATFRNVPSFVHARGVPVETSAGRAEVDLAYGGAFYASLPAARLGVAVTPADLTRIIALGREIRDELNAAGAARHPDDERLSGVYGVIFFDDLGDTPEGPHQRNVAVFADGEVDRSPCGSGTSARIALLAEEGRLAPGQVLRHDSVVGTTFLAGITEETTVHGHTAYVTEITGSAYVTGRHEFILDPADPIGTGFQLR